MKHLQVWRPVALLLWVLPLHMGAQELRDPTLPPSEMGAGPGMKADAGPVGAQGMAVIVRDGKPFLVVGSRLYAPGQQWGSVRIERITESEVWLREGKVLRKVARFAGIERRVAAPAPTCGASAPKPLPSAKVNKKSKVVSCDGAQP